MNAIKEKREALFNMWWLLYTEGSDAADKAVGEILMEWWM